MLARVTQKNETELDPALDRLVQAGLLLRHGVAPDATYVFKHALCQDVAYGTLLSEPRRALHARIAEAMEFRSPDLPTAEPEVLARHYAQAGLTEKAAVFWAKAGRHSLARSALAEAEPQLERAIALIADLPGSPAVSKLQKELLADLAKVKAQRGLDSTQFAFADELRRRTPPTRKAQEPRINSPLAHARPAVNKGISLGRGDESNMHRFSGRGCLGAALRRKRFHISRQAA